MFQLDRKSNNSCFIITYIVQENTNGRPLSDQFKIMACLNYDTWHALST